MARSTPSLPDKEEFARLWKNVDVEERRAILHAIAKGKPVRKRAHARLAVVRARQQQSYWRWAWLLAPVVALFSIPQGWAVVAVQAVALGIVMAGFARWRYRRAATAETANLGRLDGSVSAPPPAATGGLGIMDRIHNRLRARDPE